MTWLTYVQHCSEWSPSMHFFDSIGREPTLPVSRCFDGEDGSAFLAEALEEFPSIAWPTSPRWSG